MNRGALLGLLVVALLAATASGLRLTSSVDRLVARDGDLADALALAARFHASDVLFVQVDGTGVSRDALVAGVHGLADDLRAVDGVTAVRSGYTLDDLLAVRTAAAPHAAALVPAGVLAARTSAAGMREALTGDLALLLGPAGGAMEARVQADPLGIEDLALRSLRAGLGSATRAESGLLLDASGQHALLVVQTSVPIARIGPADPWVAHLQALLDAAPLPSDWLGGHRYAAATATAVKSDVQRAAGLGTLALIAVLLLGMRSLRPIAGGVVPLGVAMLGTAAGAALVSPVHGVQLGFVGALAGVAVDYWIHLYVAAAARTTGPTRADRYAAATSALRELLPALLLSAGTTALGFAALLASDLPMVHDLGVMGVATTAAALVGSVAFGPALFALVGAPQAVAGGRAWHPASLGVLAALGVALALAPGAGFDADPRHLLATSAALARAEESFALRFGVGGPQGLVVIDGPDAGAVLDRSARVEAALGALGFVTPQGPAAVLPGPATVAARTAAVPDAATVDARLAAAAADVGFAGFDGAGDRLRATLGPVPLDTWDGTLVAERATRHLVVDDHGATALVTVPLPDPIVSPAVVDTLRATDPDATWVEPQALTRAGLEATFAELGQLGPLGLLLVVGLLAARYRDPGKVAVALAPAVAGVMAAAGATAALGLDWNPVSAAVLVLLVGLALDYGVFTAEATELTSAATRRSILLGALTTVAGFGGLLVAEAPALRGVGVAQTAGVSAAAAVAPVVVPAVRASGWRGRRVLTWLGRAAFAGAVALHVDLLVVLLLVFRPPPHEAPPEFTLTGTPGDRAFGPNRLVRDDGIWLLSTEGSPYAAGYAGGLLTRDLRTRVESELFEAFETAVTSPLARFLIERGSLVVGHTLPRDIRPDDLVQIEGDADSMPDPYRFMGPSYTRRVYYHAIHDLGQALVDTPLLGCTGFAAGGAATADGHWVLARNFDFDGGVTFDRDKVVWAHRPEHGTPFLAVGFAGFQGVVSGVNADGLAVAIFAAGTDAPIRPGTPMTLIVREILETASDLDGAEAILRARTGFVSENVLVVDGEHGAAALFEVSPVRVERVDVDGHLEVSNHFRSPAFADDATNTHRMTSITTVPRLRRIEELVGRHLGALTPAIAAEILHDRRGVGDVPLARGHRQALDADIATHGVVIDATTRTVWVSRYPNLSGGFVSVSLDDALAGRLEATEVVPADPDAAVALTTWKARALLRRARKRSPKSALPLDEAALALTPDHPEALLETGLDLHALGRDAEARPLLERALAAPPEYEAQRAAVAAALAEMP